MDKYIKIKMWNLVVSKPESDNLRCKIAKKIEIDLSRKEKHSLIADTKLQVDQIKRKMEAKFKKPIFKNQIYLKVKTTVSFQVKN